ncbi:ArsR/SmtB family transcription factor [Arthrobacter sp. NPDC090010]|uniref:ArsR/SmtB family transcription factor n=1 Tax=Arthrobacter sp. NPDC090010 TaxID=3363942 RepID=UPI00382C4F1F
MDRNIVAFRLGLDDVAALRFGISPGHELAAAIRLLQTAQSRPLHWGWLRSARRDLPEEAFAVLALLIAPQGYFPDFLTGPPSPDRTPDDELETLRSTPPDVVAHQLRKVLLLAEGPRYRAVERMAEHPALALGRIAEAWSALWDALVEPHWKQVRRLLLTDITRRSGTMAELGAGAMVRGLHERVSWRPGTVQVRMNAWQEEVDCHGQGLLLVPSVLSSPWCSVLTEAPVQPTLFYPVLDLSPEWHRSGLVGDGEALRRLLGTGRAAVLSILETAHNTTDVARLCHLAPSTAVHHLTVLRDAGLVTSARRGAAVEHHRTPLGDSLVLTARDGG